MTHVPPLTRRVRRPQTILLLAISLILAIGALGFRPASTAAAVRYTFEDGSLQGWSKTGSVSAIANSTDHASIGTHSLKVTLASTSYAAAGFARVNPGSAVGSGDTLEAYVYSASTSPITAAVYVQDQAYRQTTGSAVSLAAGWTRVTYKVPSTATLPLRLVGVQFGAGSASSATLYLDEVGTVGTGTLPINTATSTATKTATTAPTSTPVPTNTPVPGITPTNTPTKVPTNTPTKTPANTPTPTNTPSAPPPSGSVLRGVNLAGADFGWSKVHGTVGADYTYPTTAELDYFKSKGLTLIRLPVLWERLQHTINGPIDTTGDIALIDSFVAQAKARGMYVVVDIHNYGRYKQNVNGTLQTYIIGSSQLPASAYANFWGQLAQHWAGNTGIYAYDLMNEPHDMSGAWPGAAQAAVNAIRQYDRGHTIYVEGDGWASAQSWQYNNSSLNVQDPSNNLVYEAHQSFDKNNSGTYANSYDADGTYPMIGADRVKPFIDWLRAHGHKGMIGEYGVPNTDARWNTVLDNFLTALDNASDVGMSGTYWAAGPWWGSYPLSVEPLNGADRPQMSILTKHLGR